MTKQEAIEDAELYADKFGFAVYVLRRGDTYKVSQNRQAGWRVAEICEPHTGLTARN